MGVGLRLFFNTIARSWTYNSDNTDGEVSQSAAQLLSEAQTLEEVDNVAQDIKHHQAVYDYVSACSEAEHGDTNDHEENQLQLVSELICSLLTDTRYLF